MVVVGAGIAGLVATLELLDSGRRVTLLDRCRPEEVGGLAREAFGGMFMVDTSEQRRSGIEDSVESRCCDVDAGPALGRITKRQRKPFTPNRRLTARVRCVRRHEGGVR